MDLADGEIDDQLEIVCTDCLTFSEDAAETFLFAAACEFAALNSPTADSAAKALRFARAALENLEERLTGRREQTHGEAAAPTDPAALSSAQDLSAAEPTPP